MSSPQFRSPRPAIGAALGLLTAVTLAAPAAFAAPLPAETTTPAPSPSSSATGSPSGTATGSGTGTATTPAAAGYRFWGFYQQNAGKWEFAQTGPYQVVPKDEAVQGWRFATASMSDNRAPRATPSFADICGKVAGEAGKKRVGVVVDYGRAADTANDANPPAAMARCALVSTGASSAEVLNAVAGPREDGGMVCAIDNWPVGTGCGEPVATLSDAAKAPDERIDISVTAPREQPRVQDAAQPAASQGPSRTLLTVIAVLVVALAAAAAWMLRRRRGADEGSPAPATVGAGHEGGPAAGHSAERNPAAPQDSPRDPDPRA
ncbi:MAG: SCO2322 family protein [Austwickia sp.]|nr:hypothetical protein [Austwickia sp.]MCO5309718.1 SCO2322 family protein [Austwickia sp.]